MPSAHKIRSLVGSPSLVSVYLRLFGLVSRFGLVLYITHSMGLKAVAEYGLVAGTAAAFVAFTGLGLDYQAARKAVSESCETFAQRIRDRCFARVAIGMFLLTIIYGFSYVNEYYLIPASLPVAIIIIMESVGYEFQQAFIYKLKPLTGSIILCLRSASWIPIVIIVGLTTPQWQTMNFVFACWAAGLLIALLVTLVAVGYNIRFGKMALALDTKWLRNDLLSAKLPYLSEIGLTAILYADRFIIEIFAGSEAAGTFIFIWSFTNAISPIVQAGIFNQTSPHLNALWQNRQAQTWGLTFLRAQRQVNVVSLPLALGTTLFVLVMLFVLRPTSQLDGLQALILTSIMALATFVRLHADLLHITLCSAHKDKEWLGINLLALVVGPSITLVCVMTAGIYGAAAAMLFTSLALLSARYYFLMARI